MTYAYEHVPERTYVCMCGVWRASLLRFVIYVYVTSLLGKTELACALSDLAPAPPRGR